MPAPIALVVSSGKASLAELGTILGAGDLYDLIEIVVIDAHNQRVSQQLAQKKEQR